MSFVYLNEEASIRAAVAKNPILSDSTRDCLFADRDSSVLVGSSLASRAKLTISQQVEFLEGGILTRDLACNPNTSSEILGKLLEDTTDKYTPLAVLGNPNTDLVILETQFKNGDADCLGALANNPCLPDAMFHKLFAEQNHRINLSLSKNICCPTDILKNLAEDGDEWLCFNVARNQRLPEDLQTELAVKNPEYGLGPLDVWRGLASNPALTDKLYRKIASKTLSIAIARATELLNLESSTWFKRNKKKSDARDSRSFCSWGFLASKS
jgi:hypothetical protein